MTTLRDLLLPEKQRNPLPELIDQLDLSSGDRIAKRSGFVIMLLLSSIIATAGVLADSTATVIGAMIIAPLGSPIQGIAIGIVSGRARLVGMSFAWLLGGLTGTIIVGALIAMTVTDATVGLSNSQIAGRTSPGLLDLLAALATGVAGAFAMTRKDLSAVLPGVAISISLVPPLAVVGATLGHGDLASAGGAFLLFLSNVLAIIIACTIVFTTAGYARDAAAIAGARRGRSYVIVALLAIAVTVPLALNSALSIYITQQTYVAATIASEWITSESGAEVTGATFHGTELVIEIRSPSGEVPPIALLREQLDGNIPDYVAVSLQVTQGADYIVTHGISG